MSSKAVNDLYQLSCQGTFEQLFELSVDLKRFYKSENIFYHLRQHINMPTRTTIRTKTLIDIIITKIDDTKTIRSGVMELGISDHNLAYL